MRQGALTTEESLTGAILNMTLAARRSFIGDLFNQIWIIPGSASLQRNKINKEAVMLYLNIF